MSPTAAGETLTRAYTLPQLEALGFVTGQNLIFEGRIGTSSDLPRLAEEILGIKPDAIVTIGSNASQVTHAATHSVPIVMFTDDPVALGLVESLARPGGNVTGIANLVTNLEAKRLELLIEAMPLARRIGVLLRTSSPSRAATERALLTAAKSTKAELSIFVAEITADYPSVFAAMRHARIDALLIGANPLFYADAALLVEFAREARVPTACEWASMARAGCVVGYGANQAVLRRRLAQYVARIFRGAAPRDLPIEQPTELELAINLRTAKALGLTIPPSLLARADEVIE